MIKEENLDSTQTADQTEVLENQDEEIVAEPVEQETEATSNETESTDSKPTAKEEDESAKKSFRKKEKKEKHDKKDDLIDELTDRVKRQMAEFDNFRKRTEKEKGQMYEVGAKSIVEKILPVVDNFERGLQGVSEEQKDDSFVQGMDKIYKQLITVLEEAGVTPIDAIGKEFDPNLHNAVMHVEDEEQEENVVVEEFQKGYMYRDSVVRHSMVKVAN